jgi:hypothetical protein
MAKAFTPMRLHMTEYNFKRLLSLVAASFMDFYGRQNTPEK